MLSSFEGKPRATKQSGRPLHDSGTGTKPESSHSYGQVERTIVSRIFDALTAVHDPEARSRKSLSSGGTEAADDHTELFPTVATPSETNVFERLKEHSFPLRGRAGWSHKRIRNYLMLALFATGLVLLGTNHAFRARGSAFVRPSVYGVAFEGAVHPASEVRI